MQQTVHLQAISADEAQASAQHHNVPHHVYISDLNNLCSVMQADGKQEVDIDCKLL